MTQYPNEQATQHPEQTGDNVPDGFQIPTGDDLPDEEGDAGVGDVELEDDDG